MSPGQWMDLWVYSAICCNWSEINWRLPPPIFCFYSVLLFLGDVWYFSVNNGYFVVVSQVKQLQIVHYMSSEVLYSPLYMRLTTLSLSVFLLSHLLSNLSTKPRWLQNNSWCRSCSSSSKIDSKKCLLTLSDSWLNSAGLFIPRCSLSGEDFLKNRSVILVHSLTDCLQLCAKYSVYSFGYVGNRDTPWCWKKCVFFFLFFFNDAVAVNHVVSSAFRSQLSLMEAASCFRASYRVKTMDSLDYRDSVRVFSWC